MLCVQQIVAATAEIAENIRLGLVAVRILNGVVKNKDASNTGKFAACVSASHIEKRPASNSANALNLEGRESGLFHNCDGKVPHKSIRFL